MAFDKQLLLTRYFIYFMMNWIYWNHSILILIKCVQQKMFFKKPATDKISVSTCDKSPKKNGQQNLNFFPSLLTTFFHRYKERPLHHLSAQPDPPKRPIISPLCSVFSSLKTILIECKQSRRSRNLLIVCHRKSPREIHLEFPFRMWFSHD